MLLSLVTGTRNRPDGLRRLIRSVERHTDVEWELAVADASDVPIEEDFGPQIKIIPEQPRLGFAKGYNKTIRLTTGKYVLWLNDDAEVTPGYATEAIEFLERHPQIGLGALYYSENGSPFRVNRSWGLLYANFGILSRELGNKIGWFDEDLTMYGADNSITYRVLLADKGVAGIPSSRILHHSENDEQRVENQKTRTVVSEVLGRKYLSRRSQMYLVYEQTKHLVGPEVISA